jgi:hypothetical protein
VYHFSALKLRNYWQSKYIPDKWKEVRIITVFKKGGRSKCENYKVISLLNEGYKIYMRKS